MLMHNGMRTYVRESNAIGRQFEEPSTSIGAQFRTPASLLNNYSNMVITHAYESSWAGEAIRASIFIFLKNWACWRHSKFFFVVFDECWAGGNNFSKYYLVVWLNELILGLYTVAFPNISNIYLIFINNAQLSLAG
jgi:hypothetical protein